MPFRTSLALALLAGASGTSKTLIMRSRYSDTACTTIMGSDLWVRGAVEDNCRQYQYASGTNGAPAGQTANYYKISCSSSKVDVMEYTTSACTGTGTRNGWIPSASVTPNTCIAVGGEGHKFECISTDNYVLHTTYNESACTNRKSGKNLEYSVLDRCMNNYGASTSGKHVKNTGYVSYAAANCTGTTTTYAWTCKTCSTINSAFYLYNGGKCEATTGNAATASKVVSGTMTFTSNACSQFQTTNGKTALQKTIASTAGLPASSYNLVAVTVSCARRLSQGERRLADKTATVAYSITVASTSSVTADTMKTNIKNAAATTVKNKLSTELTAVSITATVNSVAMPEPAVTTGTASRAMEAARMGLIVLLTVLACAVR